MGVYHAIRSTYRVLPRPFRDFLVKNPLTRKSHRWFRENLQKVASHEDLYDKEYYELTVDPAAAQTAPIIAGTLVEAIHPKSVVDVGCGTGQMLLAFKKAGVSVRGLEYSDPALEMCRSRGLEVMKFDIEATPAAVWKADLVISTEVAEHLPERFADKFVDLLCSIADVVFMTAAVPGTGGTGHYNEQPSEYWIAKFEQRGYRWERETSQDWPRLWQERGASSWYCQSTLLFRKK